MNAENLPNAVKNQSFFSNYYLDSLIVEQPQWADTPNIESDYAAIRDLFDTVAPNAEHLNEAQTEREFIQPLLEQLGHVFEVQPTLQTSQGTKRPDYAFFASGDAHAAAQSHVNTNQFFKTALAIGDAKAWSRNLDGKAQDRGDPFNNQNPSYQIDFYLRGADKLWGILTNGRQWRLYHRQTSYRLDRFYEVDLAALLTDDRDLENFRYFYCLFHRDAFTPGGDGKSFLDTVLDGSQQHTVGVSDDLKNRVYDALRLLIGGFLDFPRNRFDKTNPPLNEIHTNCLILLYRVLFILYAESRELLPLNNRDYAIQYSLNHLVADIHEKLDSGIVFAQRASRYWAHLRELFILINDGWEDHIPQYNGGLFNPQHHPFLESYEIGDDALAQVIELLTRTEQGERIVYRDLDVRHLGNIYEGLLEYQPQIAAEDLVIVSKKGGDVVAPKSSPNQEVAYPEGAVYLLTDKGERKATGSYYTPDGIVRYIVENTLAPLCEGKSVDEILSLKILDPATGSGHFLVGVVDYLAEKLITHPGATHTTDTASEDTELAYWRRRVVESCVYGVDLNPMAVELAKLSLWLHTVAKGEPLSFLDHHIRCGNSLIGAKIENLSHLPELRRNRRETSETQTEFPMTFPFTNTVATAIGHYLLIEETESRTADQIHAKEHQLDIAQTMLRFHKGVANLWTSVYFGNDVSRADYHQALNALRNDIDALENLPCYRRAQEIATEKRFFHWEIEFPEVFRDQYGREKDNPGFDVVIGNPPYVRESGNKPLFEFIQKAEPFRLHYQGKTDIYFYFIMQGIWLLKSNKLLGYIVPANWLEAVSSQKLRIFLQSEAKVRNIVVFDGLPVFEDVSVEPLVMVAEKQGIGHKLVYQHRTNRHQKAQEVLQKKEIISVPNDIIHEAGWYLKSLQVLGLNSICQKVESESVPLGMLFHVEAGINTGADAVSSRSQKYWPDDAKTGEGIFVVNKKEINRLSLSPSEAKCVKKYIPAEWVNRYFQIDHADLFLIYLQRDTDISSLPNIRVHLNRFRNILENRAEVKRNSNREWWHLLWPRDPEIYDVPKKIVIANATAHNSFYLDSKQTYYNIGCTILSPTLNIVINPSYILAVLNSRLLDLYYGIKGQTQARNQRKYFPDKVRKIPIRRINFTTPTEERDRQLEKAKTLYQFCLNKGSIDCVLGFVKHHLTADQERADVVHDLLGFLAEQMLEMNKAKGEEIRGFLRWLGREIGAEINTLKNKTRLQGYYELPFERLLGILKENHRSITVDPSARDFQERLEREFASSCTKLTPLLAHIQGTDALIDQVVYQLYGLTAEEISVVECKVSESGLKDLQD
jgi:type I restriction-modification system DNA methylase subunit